MYTERDTAQLAASEAATSRSAFVYRELKRRLLLGDFRLGARLAEAALGEELQVSRTPVREALSRLHAEGLTVRLPEGGFTPTAPDLHTIAELYEIRRGLEFTALRRRTPDLAKLEVLRDDWLMFEPPTSDKECSPDFVLHDEDFHVRLAQASGNGSVAEMLTHVNERIRIVRMHDFLTTDRVTKTIREHLGIVSTLLSSTASDADELLSSHLAISESVVEQRAALALSRMISGDHG